MVIESFSVGFSYHHHESIYLLYCSCVTFGRVHDTWLYLCDFTWTFVSVLEDFFLFLIGIKRLEKSSAFHTSVLAINLENLLVYVAHRRYGRRPSPEAHVLYISVQNQASFTLLISNAGKKAYKRNGVKILSIMISRNL